jgi:antitoxin CcdA
VPTNRALPRELVERAKALHLNLSEVAEAALAEAIRKAEREAWLQGNSDAIAGYNAHVERHGVFSDGWRRF